MESQRPVTIDEEVASLSRGAERDSLFMQAILQIPGRKDHVTVRVRNLSASGMLAETPASVSKGAPVEVELRNVGPVPGRVVWVGDGKFGIAFDRQVNPQAVRREIVKRSAPPPYSALLDHAAIYRRG